MFQPPCVVMLRQSILKVTNRIHKQGMPHMSDKNKLWHPRVSHITLKLCTYEESYRFER